MPARSPLPVRRVSPAHLRMRRSGRRRNPRYPVARRQRAAGGPREL